MEGKAASDAMAQPKRSRKKQAFDGSHINWDAFRYYTPLGRILSRWSEHPGTAMSVTEAADLAAMTRAYFSRFFHEKTHVTFKYWIDFMRVRHATSLLEATNLTVLQLAERCGFYDATTFTRTFKRISGYTPIEYKRRLQSS
jgi:transcriptional regulator GlxA family with amidase domain